MYGKLDFLHAAFGIVPANLDNYESTLDSPAFDLNGIDGQFLLERVTQEDFYLRNGMIANGSRKAKRIHEDTFLNMDFMVPSLNEQKQIGDFFRRLNNLITLHQNKCAEPPRSRNFSLAISWEQRKLGDCFEERNENMPNGELISVTINEGIKKFSELGRHDNSNEDKSKYKKVCVGDIAYNSMRMWQGASGCSPYEGIVSPAYTVLKPKDGTDSKCVSYLFKRQDMVHTFQLNSQGITSDNWNLKFPALSQIEIKLPPEIDEQKKIAAYFTDLDRLITLHQREQNHIQIYDYRSILHGSF